MKKLFYLLIAGAFAAGCSNSDNKNGGSLFDNLKKEPKTEIEKKITKRDFSISAANAYNNLFLDSMEMEQYFVDNQSNDTIIRRMRSFYNSRNYQYAWFAADGVSEQGRGFWNMYKYYDKNDTTISADRDLRKNMDRFVMAEELSVSNNKNFRNTELLLTQHFIEFQLQTIEEGFIKRKEMERFVPQKNGNSIEWADSLANKKHKDDKYYSDVNPAYGKLMEQLKKYVAVAQSGGFTTLTGNAKQYGSSASAENILTLKKRLQQSGDLAVGDSTGVFSPELTSAINLAQKQFGYTPTGKVTDALLKDLNVSVQKRVQQLLVNIHRMQWIIDKPESKMMMVNIPEFVLHIKENGKDIKRMNVVVGKEGHNTMVFTGNMSTVVFSPYWNIPESIVEKEILPAMQKNPGYLASKNMEIVSQGSSLPVIRQLPGPGNSLGKVKFLFPNSFDIYFHDTDAKALFNKDKRAFSHGCIRLEDPEWLANYVLQGNAKWTPEKINEAMNQTEEEHVKVNPPIFVLITYYTAWVDDDGVLNFRDDIYNHDNQVGKKMFTDNVL